MLSKERTGVTERLRILTDMIIKDKPTADIGADHAHLSIYLIQNDLSPWVIATEYGDAPFKRLQEAVICSGYTSRIAVRQGDGLQVLKPGEVNNIVVAGMGADNIVSILTHNQYQAQSFERYVFQPMSRPGILRQFLSQWGWPLMDEKVIYENGRYYVVISAEPGQESYHMSSLEMDIGPLLLNNYYPGKNGYLRYYLNKYRLICNNLQQASQKDKSREIDEYQDKIEALEGIINDQG